MRRARVVTGLPVTDHSFELGHVAYMEVELAPDGSGRLSWLLPL
jgi:hypothetical protein